MIAFLVAAVVLAAAFPFVESRAAEPILPLQLFRNRIFSVTSAVGLVVGFGLFGSVTFLPLYLQVVKGYSPTRSGLLMTPMMVGVLATSVASGNLISKFGRYRVFPIVGTATATMGLYLFSRLEADTPISIAARDMLVVGLGIGLVMQVLVLAAQNSVDYRLLGVATSASTMSRQIGGTIGVAVFGAIFSNRLEHALAARLPGARVSTSASLAALRRLPPAVHHAYVDAVATALHPVFLAAAGVMSVGFALSWLLQDAPLRTTAGTDAAPSKSVQAHRQAGDWT
jgi:hypothetical protein